MHSILHQCQIALHEAYSGNDCNWDEICGELDSPAGKAQALKKEFTHGKKEFMSKWPQQKQDRYMDSFLIH